MDDGEKVLREGPIPHDEIELKAIPISAKLALTPGVGRSDLTASHDGHGDVGSISVEDRSGWLRYIPPSLSRIE